MAEFKKVGLDPASVTHLFLTHADMDHAGGVDCGRKPDWFRHSRVYLSEAEMRLVQGRIPRKTLLGILPVKSPVEITRHTNRIHDGDMIEVGRIRVEVIASPGIRRGKCPTSSTTRSSASGIR